MTLIHPIHSEYWPDEAPKWSPSPLCPGSLWQVLAYAEPLVENTSTTTYWRSLHVKALIDVSKTTSNACYKSINVPWFTYFHRQNFLICPIRFIFSGPFLKSKSTFCNHVCFCIVYLCYFLCVFMVLVLTLVWFSFIQQVTCLQQVTPENSAAREPLSLGPSSMFSRPCSRRPDTQISSWGKK